MKRAIEVAAMLMTLFSAAAVGLQEDPPAELSPAATVLDKPVPVYLTTRVNKIIDGHLLAYDAENIKVAPRKGDPAVVPWSSLTPTAVYSVRRRLIDPKDANARFELGVYCWNNGLKEHATGELAEARKLEPALADQIKLVLANKYVPPAQAQSAGAEPDEPKEPRDRVPNQIEGQTDKAKMLRFKPATPEEAQAAVADAREKALKIVKQLGVPLRLLETDHFLIFSNWPVADDAYLRNIFEQMYRAVSRQFNIDPTYNIWYGKMPVYAFSRQADFIRFATTIDQAGNMAGAAGYARSRSDGAGHIVIWASGRPIHITQLIVHEGTHAFLARYRTNMHVASWLNEGLAQAMEEIVVPKSGELARARRESIRIAQTGRNLAPMFTARNIPFDLYPVALTMTDLLVSRNRRAYTALIDDIKDGMDVEEALKKNYKLDYAGLTRLWHAWAATGFK